MVVYSCSLNVKQTFDNVTPTTLSNTMKDLHSNANLGCFDLEEVNVGTYDV